MIRKRPKFIPADEVRGFWREKVYGPPNREGKKAEDVDGEE